MNNLRIFFVGGLIAYRALFNWLNPWIFVPTLVVAPIFQLLFFAFLGRSAGLESDRFYVIGNALQIAALPGLFAMTFAISGERWSQTLSPLLATPANRAALFLGRALPVVVNAAFVCVVSLVAGALILGVHIAVGGGSRTRSGHPRDVGVVHRVRIHLRRRSACGGETRSSPSTCSTRCSYLLRRQHADQLAARLDAAVSEYLPRHARSPGRAPDLGRCGARRASPACSRPSLRSERRYMALGFVWLRRLEGSHGVAPPWRTCDGMTRATNRLDAASRRT